MGVLQYSLHSPESFHLPESQPPCLWIQKVKRDPVMKVKYKGKTPMYYDILGDDA